MKKTAIILGATGLTGSLVLEQLIDNENYSTIKLFSRSSTGINHPKVKEYIGDLLEMETFKTELTGDEVYICIGTTKKKTPNQETYRKIDFGIPSKTASICKQNGVLKLAVVSALGANKNSSIAYNRFKGEMEQAILDTNIDQTFILRPSFISGNRQEHRAGEKFGIAIFNFLKVLLPKKYRAIDAKSIASKMIELCNSDKTSRILESNEI